MPPDRDRRTTPKARRAHESPNARAMTRGEIRWYRFGTPDKRRPVLVLTRHFALGYLGEVTVAPITRTIRGIDSEVALTVADGMSRDCAINCDHLQTVPKSKLGPLITTLGPGRLDQVGAAVLFALGSTR